MPKTPQEIDATATAMKAAGAPDTDIQRYVSLALGEIASGAPQTALPPPARIVAPTPVVQAPMAAAAPTPQSPNDMMAAFERSQLREGNMTDADFQQNSDAARKVLGVAAQLSPMAVPGLGVVPTVARGLLGGWGYLANQAITNQQPKLSDAARSMILSGMPVPKVAAAPLLSAATVGNVVKGAVMAGGTVAAANYAGDAIDKGTAVPYDDYKEAFKNTLVPALIGAATLGAAGKLESVSALQAEADSGKIAAAKLGMMDPALGDVLPKQFGAMQASIASSNQAFAAKVAQARSPIIHALYTKIGDAPLNEEVATQLQPLIGKMDEVDAAYGAASDRLDKAQATAAQAKANIRLTDKQRDDILTGTQAEVLSAITDQAKANIAATVLGGELQTQTGHAEAMTGVVKDLFKARTDIASDMIRKTGIDPNAAVFDRDTQLAAAKAALGPDADSMAGKNILSTIENFGSMTGKDAVAARTDALNAKLRQAALTGRTLTVDESRALFSPPKGQLYDSKTGSFVKPPGAGMDTPTDATYLSLEDFKRLRDSISDGFFNKIDTNNMNNAERLASKAYAAMGDANTGQIASVYGDDAAKGYTAFKSFWRDTSQLRDSDFGRALLRGEVSDSTVASMADKLATGQVDEVKNFKNFVDLIRPQNSAVADNAMATMGSAVRNSMLQRATGENGDVDYRKLGNLIRSAVSKTDFPFPVESFRLGDRATIDGWTKALQGFKSSDLTDGQIQSFMESPQIQSVLQVGGTDVPDKLKQGLAGLAFGKRVDDAVALRQAGALAPARAAFAEASNFANQAGVDANTAQQAVKDAEANPLLSVFRGKGGYRLTNEAAEIADDKNTVTGLINGMKRSEASAFMGALDQQQPSLADMVRRRYTANVMSSLTRDEPLVPGEIYGLDSQKVRQFVQPLPGETDTRFSKLAAVIGPDKAKEFNDFAQGVAKMNDNIRASAIAAKEPNALAQAAGTTALAGSHSIQRGRSVESLISRINTYIKTKRFNMASAALLDDGLRNQLNRTAGDFSDALTSMPVQKSYLLLQDPRILNELGRNDSQSP